MFQFFFFCVLLSVSSVGNLGPFNRDFFFFAIRMACQGFLSSLPFLAKFQKNFLM